MKIAVFGVREIERSYFISCNRFNYDLNLVSDFLSSRNMHLCQGCDVVLVRGNCSLQADILDHLKEIGVQYLLTRTVGFNHIDLPHAKKLGFELCARVPAYSPHAVSELAVSMVLSLTRKTIPIFSHSSEADFTVYDSYFAKEIAHSTVGLIGIGRIGIETAKVFKAMGANLLAYDPYPSELAKELAQICSLDELLSNSDAVIIHSPYFKDQNHHMINTSFLQKLKKNAILVNVSRGEIVDLEAVLKSLQIGHLGAFASDVLERERDIFFQARDPKCLPYPIKELLEFNSRVLLTPHIGSFTETALINMIDTSYENLNEFLTTEKCENNLL